MKKDSQLIGWTLMSSALLLVPQQVPAAPSTTPKQPQAVHAPAPSAAPTPAPSTDAKGKSEGEIDDIRIKGSYKGQLQVGKIDPPAAFNLEDIQNFPEERLHPVLNNPVNFEEGRDFTALMDFQDEKLVHPWIPELPQAPFLTMKGDVDSNAKDWNFSIIDQVAGAIYTQAGKGAPPASLSWNGEDKERGYVAVDTVYIPQISLTNKEGYHRTYPGQPAQFSAIRYGEKGKTVMELSAKVLFQDKKPEFSKEGTLLLDKVSDVIREENRLPVTIRAYDSDADLAQQRQQAIMKYLKDKLYVAESQIIRGDIEGPEKRGTAFAILLNGGAQ
jgi:hypothetical protein